MKIPFTTQEKAAIAQLSKIMDIAPEQVVVQSVRLFQLWKMNKIIMSFPSMVDSVVIKDEPPSTELVILNEEK
jgi:hypothetical protein